jgi:hypothetical protein
VNHQVAGCPQQAKPGRAYGTGTVPSFQRASSWPHGSNQPLDTNFISSAFPPTGPVGLALSTQGSARHTPIRWMEQSRVDVPLHVTRCTVVGSCSLGAWLHLLISHPSPALKLNKNGLRGCLIWRRSCCCSSAPRRPLSFSPNCSRSLVYSKETAQLPWR